VSKLLLRPVAQGLLAVVVDHYADAGVALPERRVIVPGAPGVVAWDCEQVTLALANIATQSGVGNRISLVPQTGGPASVGLARLATWAIQVVRCTPTSDDDGNPPSADKLDEAAAMALDDAGLLSQCLVELASLTPGTRPWLPIGAVINAGQVTPLGPEGGFQGIEATASISAMVTD
jgi:hypothetical protein